MGGSLFSNSLRCLHSIVTAKTGDPKFVRIFTSNLDQWKYAGRKNMFYISKYTFGLTETARELQRNIMVVQIIGLSTHISGSRTLIQYPDWNFAAKVCDKFAMKDRNPCQAGVCANIVFPPSNNSNKRTNGGEGSWRSDISRCAGQENLGIQ